MDRNRLAIAASLVVASGSGFCIGACGTSQFNGAESDASTQDAAVDVSADAPQAVDDSGGPTFCESLTPPPLFCDDFDEGDLRIAFGKGTQGLILHSVVSDAGTLQLTDSGESSSHALSSELPLFGSGVTNSAAVVGALDSVTAGSLTLDVDIRFDTVGDVSGLTHVYLGELKTIGKEDTQTYDFVLYNSEVHVDIGAMDAGVNSIPLGNVPVPGPTWHHLQIELVLGAVPSVSANFDGVSSTTLSGYTTTVAVTPAVYFGLVSPGGAGAVSVSFDNAILKATSTDAGDGG